MDTVLEVLAATIGDGSGVFQRDGYVYVGPPSATDQAVEVFYVPSGEAAEWRELYQIVATESSSISAVGDIIVVRDNAEGIGRVQRFHNTISGGRRQFALEVVFTELTQGDLNDLGIDFSSGGLARIQLGDDDADSLSLDLVVDAFVRAEASASEGASSTHLRLLVVEGETATVQMGDTINVRRRVASAEGTVSDVGFDSFDTGVLLSVTAHGLATNLIRLDVEPEISEVRELLDGLPTVSTRSFGSTAVLGDGGIAVLGGLSRKSASLTQSTLPGVGVPTRNTNRHDQTDLYVFIRIKEISYEPPTTHAPAAPPEPTQEIEADKATPAAWPLTVSS